MGDDLDGPLPCVGAYVGHRVMVPPRRAGVVANQLRSCVPYIHYDPYENVIFMDRQPVHSHRLWCSDGRWEKLTA
ncbi:hypothetical protein GCM10010512_20800 [Streptomyces thermoviolaceus subsp. thermoviolaceus]|nr:hypothetical protein GCM10010499_26410 [Streptomyces thermoviolaceus subsp. apingens]GHA89110.1 hypothetical protein GCM10010512_20800 [Streptomyces thermoviolaceus subsp. thermoviolaceus]